MPQGLQCFDLNGNIILNVTDRLTRVIDIASTGTSNGSVTNSELATGTPWFLYERKYVADSAFSATINFTLSGNTISWTHGAVGTPRDYYLYYGVF